MKKLIITSIAFVTVASITGLVINQTQIGAEEKPVIYTQVEEHEGRITTLETDVDNVEAKVDNNTEQIKQVVTNVERVEVVHKEYIATQEASPSAPVAIPPTPPVVVTDPYKIVSSVYRFAMRDNGMGAHICTYTVHNGEIWWTASSSAGPNFQAPRGSCQYDNENILTPEMKRNLTNRPYDLGY